MPRSLRLLSVLFLLAASFPPPGVRADPPRPPGARAAEAHAHARPAATSPHTMPFEVGDIRINEILAGPARDWDGSGAFSSRDDEWIEIANIGSAAQDLSGFYVTDGDSVPRYAFTGTLAPGARCS